MGRCYNITLRESTQWYGRRPAFSRRPAPVIPREGGVSSTLRLLGSITTVSGILDRPPSRTMTTEYEAAFSRRNSPELCFDFTLSRKRGRREDRVHAAPAVSCANAHKRNAHEHTGTGGASRPSPRNGFTAYFVLSPVNGFFATVAAQGVNPAQLDASTAASEPHDFAVRVCQPRQSWLPRPPHPTARFVTIANRPSCRVGRRRNELICTRTKGEYFRAGYWTKCWRDLPDGQHRHW